MLVYFIRHGVAVPRGAPGVMDDGSRDLTRDGIRKLEREAEGLARLKVSFERIWTSPLLRARRTAEVLAEAMRLVHKPTVLPALAPGGNFQNVLDQLATRKQLRAVALVGHEPDMSSMASRLLSGLKSSFLQLKKGGVACIEIGSFQQPVRGELLWLMTPKQLRGLA